MTDEQTAEAHRLGQELRRAKLHYENVGFVNCAGLSVEDRAKLEGDYAIARANVVEAQARLDAYVRRIIAVAESDRSGL